jgi:xanthine/uracil permease
LFKFKENITTILAGFQWLSFLFVNTVVIPLSVGEAYHLSSLQISGNMARSFILTGLACLIQVLCGHRLPLMEGQTGLWWGVILSIASMGLSSGKSLVEVGGSLSVGIMLGGAAVILFGIFGLHKLLNKLFTPIVMAVLLLLLASQLINIFFAGMMGITSTGKVQGSVAILSIFLVILVSVLTIAGRGLLSNFSILIGIIVGWIMYAFLFGTSTKVMVPHFHDIAEIFVWGKPAYDIGIIIAGICTAMINTSNAIATFRAAESLLGISMEDGAYRRSFVLSGTYTLLSGIFSTVPYAPYTSSIGFLQTTRLFKRAPFIIGSVLLIILGCVPQLASFFSTLPISVGDAVLFVAYLQLFGSALRNIEGMHFTFKSIFRIALPTLVGLAVMATPSSSFASIHGFMHAIFSNGMLVGILLAVILENTIPWTRLESHVDSEKSSFEAKQK